MHATDIAAYATEAGDILCPSCADRRPHRFTVYIGRRTGTLSRGALIDGSIDLGTHETLAHAVEYAREAADIALDDDGEIMDDSGDGLTRTHWTTSEIDDGDPIYASTETDTPQHCADCGRIIETTWTRDCRRYVAEKIADYVTEGHGDAETLQAWADYAEYGAHIDRARHIYSEVGDSWTHGTLRTADLLDAAADCAAELADLCPDDADDLRRLAAEGRDAVQHLEEEDEEEDDGWLLEEIADAINAALPTPLYYGSTEGDGSDIGVWCSAGY